MRAGRDGGHADTNQGESTKDCWQAPEAKRKDRDSLPSVLLEGTKPPHTLIWGFFCQLLFEKHAKTT